VSVCVQALPSLQDAVLFVLAQPVTASQESVVHTLLSLQFSGTVPVQVPPEHTSTVVHTLLSLHEAVLFA
jgi:hypothetical protein